MDQRRADWIALNGIALGVTPFKPGMPDRFPPSRAQRPCQRYGWERPWLAIRSRLTGITVFRARGRTIGVVKGPPAASSTASGAAMSQSWGAVRRAMEGDIQIGFAPQDRANLAVGPHGLPVASGAWSL